MGFWQIVFIAMCCMGVGIVAAKHGEYKTDEKYNVWTTLIGALIEIGILYAGGFFS